MKVLVICSDLVEEVEMLTPIDILKRGGVEVIIASVSGSDSKNLVTSHGLKIETDCLIDEISDYSAFDGLFIPGGTHYKELEKDERVRKIATYFMNNDKYVFAICAAPTLLGKFGLLKGRSYTCFESMNADFGGFYTDEGVTVDQKLITSKSVYYSMDFALTILKVIKPEVIETVKKSIYCYD